MKAQTKLICIGALVMIALSSIIVVAVFDDVEGPFIYQVDIMPTSPAAGDRISIAVYCIDTSGVSGADLSVTINGEEMAPLEMRFLACLCIAGGRWTASFGPVEAGDEIAFYATAYDDSLYQNPADTETFTIEIEA